MASSMDGDDNRVLFTQVKEIHEAIVANSPIYKFALSDVKLAKVSPSLIEATLLLSDFHLNSKGTLHGSVTATIFDWIGGLCICSLAEEPAKAKRGVSLDIHVSYVGVAKKGQQLVIQGTADKVGRTIAFIRIEIRVRDVGDEGKGKLVATGSHNKFVG